MKPRYTDELVALGSTYEQALVTDIAALRGLLLQAGMGPALFVGSGGTMAIATLAAALHERTCRQPARAVTALGALESPVLAQRGMILFSSSAKHPDAQQVLARFAGGRHRPAGLVTHRRAEDVRAAAGPDARIVQLPEPPRPDGFLATNSILQIATLVTRAYLEGARLPSRLPETALEPAPLRGEVLVLSGEEVLPAAIDLEVRLAESGLAAAQVVDYRNFAHGRHTGFAHRIDEITVIAMSADRSRELAESTVHVLPARADVRYWPATVAGDAAVLELLARSIRLVGQTAAVHRLDPARPRVPQFGRRLYRLPIGPKLTPPADGPVERKLLALGAGTTTTELHSRYERARAAFGEALADARFAAITLDYDGTVCWTGRRTEPPAARMQSAITRLLDRGLFVAFASGRGQSLHHDLRAWLPEHLWDRVLLGLYNGAVHLRLCDALPDLREPSPWSAAVAAAIETLPIADELKVAPRGAQVSVELNGRVFVHEARLAGLVSEVLAGDAATAAKVVASGHSLDIVAPDVSKASVVDAAENVAGGEVLAIGDQGQPNGNDFELLAHDRWSLTVDRCSADPTRCWYAGDGKRVGPDLLIGYLGRLRKRRDGFAIVDLPL